MSLIARISADRNAAMEEQLQVFRIQAQEADRRREYRATIVFNRVKEFAAQIGEQFAELTPVGSTRYFAVGDTVLLVRQHGIIDAERALTTRPREVLWQYAVALVGIDIVGSVHEVGRGTLLMLSYEGISSALVEGVKIGRAHV